MERVQCSSKGWTRVAYVDMSSSHKQHCPGNFMHNHQMILYVATCGSIPEVGCPCAAFSIHGVSYSQVCSRVHVENSIRSFGPFNHECYFITTAWDCIGWNID